MLPFTQEAFNQVMQRREFRVDGSFFTAMQAVAIRQLFPDGIKAFVRDANDTFIINYPRLVSHMDFREERFNIEFETAEPGVVGNVVIFNNPFINFTMNVGSTHPGNDNPHIPHRQISLTDFCRNKVKATLLELEDVYNTYLIDGGSRGKVPSRSPKVIGDIYYQRNASASREDVLNSFKGHGHRYLADIQPFIHDGGLVDCIVHRCSGGGNGTMYMASCNLLTAMELEDELDDIRNKSPMHQPPSPMDEKSEKFFGLCLDMVRELETPNPPPQSNPHVMAPGDNLGSM